MTQRYQNLELALKRAYLLLVESLITLSREKPVSVRNNETTEATTTMMQGTNDNSKTSDMNEGKQHNDDESASETESKPTEPLFRFVLIALLISITVTPWKID